MADKSIGTAYVDLKVKADAKSQTQAFATIGNAFKSLPGGLGQTIGQASKLGEIFADYGKSLTVAGSVASNLTTIVAGGAGAVGGAIGTMVATVAKADSIVKQNANSWKDLETQILTINGIVGGTSADFDKFKTAILDVAGSTSWTAEQVAQGVESLTRAGLNVAESTSAIGIVANLAKGQISEMGAMGDLISNTRNQFGLAISDFEHIADVITTSTASSAQNVQDFTEAIKMAGSTAGKMGQSLERTAAQINALANVGIKGSMGGTAINALIARVAGNENAQAVLDNLRVASYDESGKMRPIDEIFTDVANVMEQYGFSDEQKNNLWRQLAGTENLKSALALSGGYLTEIANTLKEIDGTTKRQAQAVDSGLKGAQEILASAQDALTKKLGEAGADGLKDRTERQTAGVDLASVEGDATAVAIKRFADASAVFGDIAGSIEIAKQQLMTSLVSLGADIVEGFAPLIELVAEILNAVVDRNKYLYQQNKNVLDKEKATRRQETVDLQNKTAQQMLFNNETFKEKALTTSDGQTLKGEKAYNYARDLSTILKGKVESGTATDAEKQTFERLNNFVLSVEDAIIKVQQGAVNSAGGLMKNADDETLKTFKAINDKSIDALQKQYDKLKPIIESGAVRENGTAEEKALLSNYSLTIKRLDNLKAQNEQIKATLRLRETGAIKTPTYKKEEEEKPEPKRKTVWGIDGPITDENDPWLKHPEKKTRAKAEREEKKQQKAQADASKDKSEPEPETTPPASPVETTPVNASETPVTPPQEQPPAIIPPADATPTTPVSSVVIPKEIATDAGATMGETFKTTLADFELPKLTLSATSAQQQPATDTTAIEKTLSSINNKLGSIANQNPTKIVNM